MVKAIHDIGDLRELKVQFRNVSDVLIDPTTVVFRMIEPDATLTTGNFPNLSGDGITVDKDSTGTYSVVWPVDQAGVHRYKWIERRPAQEHRDLAIGPLHLDR